MKKSVLYSGVLIFLGCSMLILANDPQTNIDSPMVIEKEVSIDPIHPPVLLPTQDNHLT